MVKNITNRIAVKLVFWVVVFSSILTFSITGWQLYGEYNEDLRLLSNTIEEATARQLVDVRASVETGDSNSINELLVHFLHNSGVAYAAVLVDDRVAWEQGEKLPDKYICSTFSLSANDDGEEGSSILEVIADIQPVYNEFFHRFVRSSVTNGVKIFLTAGFVFLMCQFFITRHLESLAEQLSRKSMHSFDPSISLKRTPKGGMDEFDQVIAGLNQMQQEAQETYAALARKEEQLLLFFDSTEEAILGVSGDGKCSYANNSCLHLLNIVNSSNIIGKRIESLFVHQTANAEKNRGVNEVSCLVSRSIKEGSVQKSEQGTLVVRGGIRRLVALRSFPVLKDGVVTGAVVFVKDNSEASKLRYQSELLNQAVEQLPVMVIIAATDKKIQFVNHGVEHLTGYVRKELLGQSIYTFADISVEGRMDMDDILRQTLRGQHWEGVIRTSSKSGVILNLYCIISPVLNEQQGVDNIILVCREISYEIALQNELINSKKMEAVGRLSASFAHEFGNPLFGVHSVLKDFSQRINLSVDDKKLTEMANLECEKMLEMVREFQEQYRETRVSRIHQTVEHIVGEVVEEVLPLIDSQKIQSEITISSRAGVAVYNKSRLSLAIRNIVVNAIESMSLVGGKLRIVGKVNGDTFELCVGDRGPGIKEEHFDLVFEPFFSTKSKMEGAGLGLSLAYGAIRSMGGQITFASDTKVGTVFTISLPLP